jgi:CheY-like chemotaxis protein
MLIDDDAFYRLVLHHSLQVLGLTAITLVEDGREALKMLATRTSPPDYLICDVYMPNMDGFEFLEFLEKTRYRGKIILISGASPEMLTVARDLAVAGGLNVVAVLLKPVSQNLLAEVMEIDALRPGPLGSYPDALTTPLSA